MCKMGVSVGIQLLKSIILFILLAFLTLSSAYAQEQNDRVAIQNDHTGSKIESENKETLILSKTDLEPRVPSKSVIEKYKGQYRFKYATKEQQIEDTNWLSLVFMQILSFFFYLMGFPLVKILLIIAVLTFILWRLVKIGLIDTEGFSRNRKTNKQFNGGFDTLDDDLEHNYDKLINDAIDQKDYRLAIRLLFLKNLKALSDRELIVWEKKKTNNNYIYEISDSELRKSYAQNSLVFDYVWYGEFEIDEADFAIIRQQYNEFYKEVSRYAVS